MEIKYLGHSSFLIKTSNPLAEVARIIVDPFDPVIGLKFPKVEAVDVVTVSHNHKDHNYITPFQPSTSNSQPSLIIDMPGEFEKKGVRIFGFRSFHDKKMGAEKGEVVMYKFESENISVLHCGDLGFVPDDAFIESIGDVDILMVPVGGIHSLEASEAQELVKKIEPTIILPMHYNNPKLNQELFGKLAPVSEFLKKFGVESLQPIPKLVIRKEELEQEMKVVTLEISS
jgi:L-ascorbate metabolism protein UlaG (beta-lactamase superfamily)